MNGRMYTEPEHSVPNQRVAALTIILRDTVPRATLSASIILYARSGMRIYCLIKLI